jgi:hypothetical protein
VSANWVFLPVVGAPVAHAPVLKFDLLAPLKRPISERAFGRNKTWRGALMMSGGTLAAAALLSRSAWYRGKLPPELRARPLLTGALLGAAVVVGELPNSFVKRRLGIPPGRQRHDAVGAAISVYDQADWVLTAWLLLAPVYRMTAREAAQVFALVGAIHIPVNLVGYAVGARTSPL